MVALDRVLAGRPGTLEDLASGSALRREATAAGLQPLAQDVLDAIAAGDARAQEVWDGVVAAAGVGLANVAWVFSPEVIVVGGGLGLVGEVLLAPLREAVGAERSAGDGPADRGRGRGAGRRRRPRGRRGVGAAPSAPKRPVAPPWPGGRAWPVVRPRPLSPLRPVAAPWPCDARSGGGTSVTGLVVLVRHGETEWSRDGRHTGRTDVPLTDVGRRQAVAAGSRLTGRTWAMVLTSPLLRATETCRLAGLGRAGRGRSRPGRVGLRGLRGTHHREIHDRNPSWSLWDDGCPNGERASDVAARADRVIARCRGVDGDVAVFAHGHLLRVLGARWIGRGTGVRRSPAAVDGFGERARLGAGDAGDRVVERHQPPRVGLTVALRCPSTRSSAG